MNQSSGNMPPQDQDQTPEQQVITPITWDELEEMRQQGALPDFVPGMVITGIPTIEACDTLQNYVVASVKRRYEAKDEEWSMHGTPSAKAALERAGREQKLWYKELTAFRAVIMEPDEAHMRTMQDKLVDPEHAPNVTVAYKGDVYMGGISQVREEVTILRTYAVGRESGSRAQAAIAAGGEAELSLQIRTRAVPNRHWRRLVQMSQEMGHMTTALAMEYAASAGLPELGRHRKGAEFIEDPDRPLPDFEDYEEPEQPTE